MGYLVYDTAFSLAFFSLRSGAVMLAHHLVGLAGCAIGAAAAPAGGTQRAVAALRAARPGASAACALGACRRYWVRILCLPLPPPPPLHLPPQACTPTSWRCLGWPSRCSSSRATRCCTCAQLMALPARPPAACCCRRLHAGDAGTLRPQRCSSGAARHLCQPQQLACLPSICAAGAGLHAHRAPDAPARLHRRQPRLPGSVCAVQVGPGCTRGWAGGLTAGLGMAIWGWPSPACHGSDHSAASVPAAHTPTHTPAATQLQTTCRVLIANAYLAKLLLAVLALEARPWWAWAGARRQLGRGGAGGRGAACDRGCALLASKHELCQASLVCASSLLQAWQCSRCSTPSTACGAASWWA